MTIDAEAHADLAIGPAILQAFIGLKGSIDDLGKQLAKVKANERAYAAGAISRPLRKAKSSPSSGDFVMGFEGPAYGRRWELTTLVVGGAQWTSVVGGLAVAFVSPTGAQLTPATPDVVWEFAALPAVETFSAGQIVIRHPNELHVMIHTPTASTQYAAGGTVLDLPDRPDVGHVEA